MNPYKEQLEKLLEALSSDAIFPGSKKGDCFDSSKKLLAATEQPVMPFIIAGSTELGTVREIIATIQDGTKLTPAQTALINLEMPGIRAEYEASYKTDIMKAELIRPLLLTRFAHLMDYKLMQTALNPGRSGPGVPLSQWSGGRGSRPALQRARRAK